MIRTTMKSYGRGIPLPYMVLLFTLLMVLMGMSLPAIAQDNPISDNDVLAVAEKMYCPVCENIPLDECQTITCIEWKEEIRIQLSEGQTEEQVINSFIDRFGDHVVGTPQDPVLRTLTIVIPIITGILTIIAGVYTFTRFGKNQKLKMENETIDAPSVGNDKSDDDYRQQLERDLLARR